MFQTVLHKTALLDLVMLRSHLQCNTSSADNNVTKTLTEVYVFVNWIIQDINECEPTDYSK